MFIAGEVRLRRLFQNQNDCKIKVTKLFYTFISFPTFATLADTSFGLKSNTCCSIELDWSWALSPADVQFSSWLKPI